MQLLSSAVRYLSVACAPISQGSESIGNATKIGLMEMLTIAKDTDLCTKEFKVDELTRHFTTANAQVAVANSGSVCAHALSLDGHCDAMAP